MLCVSFGFRVWGQVTLPLHTTHSPPSFASHLTSRAVVDKHAFAPLAVTCSRRTSCTFIRFTVLYESPIQVSHSSLDRPAGQQASSRADPWPNGELRSSLASNSINLVDLAPIGCFSLNHSLSFEFSDLTRLPPLVFPSSLYQGITRSWRRTDRRHSRALGWEVY